MRRLLPFLLLLTAVAFARMTVEDVLRLVKAGVSEDIVLEQIRVQRQTFDLTADQIVQLKQGKVSERVIRAMMSGPANAPSTSHAAAIPARSTLPSRPQPPATASNSPAAPASPPPVAAARPAIPMAPLTSPVAPVRWVPHSDPMGFSLKLPADWQLQADRKTGRIAIRGTQSQQAIVWPMFIERQSLDRQSAGTLLRELARRVNPELAWGTPDVQEGAARMLARGTSNGAAIIRWNPMPDGTAVYLFCVTAPASLYGSSVDVFTEILKSFRIMPAADQTPSEKAAAPSEKTVTPSQPIQWTRWTDPREGAFGVSIPRGWNITGGSIRRSATDVRKNVVVVAPDQQIRIALGDADIGAYAVPNAMYARGGLRPGMNTSIGDGSTLQIRAFLPAGEFLRQYLAGPALRDCTGLNVLSESARPDLGTASEELARARHLANVRITTSGISFSCTWNGRPARGYYAAATVLVPSQMGGIWYVDPLYGFLATTGREQEAETISRHVNESSQVNSDWKRQEDQIAANAVQQDNARSEEIQARARQAIAENQRATSDMIVKGYEARSRVYDEISRKRENAILGTVDVVDPGTGRQFKVDNYSDYHWMNNQGVIAGTKTDSSPGIDWRQMITLP